MKKLLLIALILSSGYGFAQEDRKPIQVDEFGYVNCGDLLPRIDHLWIQLNENPDASAFIVLNPRTDDDERTIYYERFIRDIFERREFDMTRITFVRGSDRDAGGGSFWLMPPGSVRPVDAVEDFAQKKEMDLSKAFIFGSEGDEDPCPSFPFPTYARILRSDPNIRGHIVIYPYTNSSLNRKKQAEHWLQILTTKHSIPSKQLRVFFGKAKDSSYTEFWIVPKKK